MKRTLTLLASLIAFPLSTGYVYGVQAQPVQDPTQVMSPDIQAKIPETEASLIHLQKEITKAGGLTPELINVLNEVNSLNTEGQRGNDSDRKAAIGDVTCIQDSKIVISPDPRLLGTSTANWKDAQGALMLPKIVAALGTSQGFSRITYTQNVGSLEANSPSHTQTCTIIAAKSEKLLGGKNSTGRKFLCYKVVK